MHCGKYDELPKNSLIYMFGQFLIEISKFSFLTLFLKNCIVLKQQLMQEKSLMVVLCNKIN